MVSRKLWLALSLLGVLVAVVVALAGVHVRFGDDPLLRLRDLDPQLSPPSSSADCGSAWGSLHATPRGTSLHELARAHACQQAGRRRLLIAGAAGGGIVVLGLAGAVSVSRGGPIPGRRDPVPIPSG